MKAKGLTSGVPDLTIPEPFGAYHGLYIEMKTKDYGVVEGQQEEIMGLLINRGYMVRVCWSFEEFVSTVKEYFGQEERKAA
jgi:hypothetical protein